MHADNVQGNATTKVSYTPDKNENWHYLLASLLQLVNALTYACRLTIKISPSCCSYW